MLMGRIAQAGPALPTSVQGLRHQTADLEAPGGSEIIYPPVVALHSGELRADVGQMRGEVLTGAPLAQIPDDLTGGDDKRGKQGTHSMPDLLVLAFFRLARGHGLGRGLALQNLPAGLVSGAQDHTPLRQEA